jgi:hypothetical protein
LEDSGCNGSKIINFRFTFLHKSAFKKPTRYLSKSLLSEETHLQHNKSISKINFNILSKKQVDHEDAARHLHNVMYI